MSVIKEEHRGCVQLRLYESDPPGGAKEFAVEVSVWNPETERPTLLSYKTEFSLEAATASFEDLVTYVGDYDWVKHDFIPFCAAHC